MKRFCLLILSIGLFFSSAWADGTRQLWPNTNTEADPNPYTGNNYNQCFFDLGAREGSTGPSRPFARYNHSDKESCAPEHRLYFRVKDGETVCLGLGGFLYNHGTYDKRTTPPTSSTTAKGFKDRQVMYRIKNSAGTIVWPTDGNIDGTAVPSSGQDGYIENYKQAYRGPRVGTRSYPDNEYYKPIKIENLPAGDYYIEFDIGCDINSTKEEGQDVRPFDFMYFDLTVVNSNNIAQSGRLWSKAWGLDTGGDNMQVWGAFYTMSTDGYLSKVFMSGAQPYRFVFGCNSFGATDEYEDEPNGVEKNRQSYPNANTFMPEYPVFLTRPDDDFFNRIAQVPNIPKDLTFAGDAMSCEDLLFVVQLMFNEDATIELMMDTDGDGVDDMIIADRLLAEKSKSRGYHYPWKDQDAIKAAGTYWYAPPTTTGRNVCLKKYKLSLFDQRFTYNSVGFNIGDTIDFSLPNMAGGSKNDFKTADTTMFRIPLGRANNPILIRNQADLDSLALAVNTGSKWKYTIPDFLIDKETGEHIPATFTLDGSNGFEGVNFYLIAPTGSIELGSDWEGIGDWEEAKPFKGVFRAGRYAPNPLTDNTSEEYAQMTGDQDTITFTNAQVGLFAYCDGATIDNVHIKGSIETGNTHSLMDDDFLYNAGICAYAQNTSFKNCSNACEISNSLLSDTYECYMGGIVAYAEHCTIDSCTNYAPIYSVMEYSAVGGIVGQLNDVSSIIHCSNMGSIETNGGSSAGICAMVWGETTITNCKNEGGIIGGKSGGIVGISVNGAGIGLSIEDGENNASIYGDQSSGGIAGDVVEGTIIRHCLDTYDEGITLTNRATIVNSISVKLDKSSLDYYDGTTIKTYDVSDIDELTLESGVTLNDEHFAYIDEGTYSLYETMCCGQTLRIETAGRLYEDKQSFYIKWDGKKPDGTCAEGEITVKYQKNSGVTHFPFFDPENIREEESRTGGLKGLVVYRISPIQDSITKFDNDDYWSSSATDGVNGASEYQREHYDHSTDNAKSVYNYQQIPAEYYQTENLSDEYGIEMNLYWDDRRIKIDNKACEQTEVNGLVIGQNTGFTATVNNDKCNKSSNICRKTSYNVKYITSNGKTMYYCPSEKWKAGWTCEDKYKWYDTTWLVTPQKPNCQGIENVSEGGYLGSKGGGHIFPIQKFGNNHTINTWWNGVEVQSLNKLSLHEFSPASFIITTPMPIEISLWQAQNLPKSVLLEWTTASEENNDYFTIERSINGVSWVAIGTVKGAGTTTAENYYSFEDKKPVAGISYYRLKQTDFNGEYSYSSVKCINRPNKPNNSFTAYTKQDANAFIVEGDVIAACPIEIYNAAGTRIYNVSFNTVSVNKVIINVHDLASGTYFVKICNGSKAVVKNW